MIAAGTGVPGFLPELVVLVGGAAVIGYLSSRVRVVPIVGFLLAGVVIGPGQLGLVQEREVIDAAAEIGVILLLFTIGIEFSLDRLNEMRRLIGVGGGVQVVATVAITTGIAAAAGVPTDAAIFTGMIVALSSTALVMKLLRDRGEMNSGRGRGAVGMLLFQDLAVVAMVLFVPLLAGTSGGGTDILVALATAVGLIVGVLVVARKAMPPLLDAVARTCSPEVFLLALVAICFGTALLSAWLGVSVSLGAFLAGIVISESRHSTHAIAEILPLQVLFSATFFVSIGMLLDLGFLIEEPVLVVGVIVATLAIKAVTGFLGGRLAGLTTPVAASAGLLIAQVGEFSFVLERLGAEEGLSPLDLGTDGSQALIALTVVLMTATPALAGAGEVLRRRLERNRRPTTAATDTVADGQPGRHHGHLVVLGLGAIGRAAITEARRLGLDTTVITLDPDAGRAAEI